MWSFGALCDEFYITTRLYLKLDLDPSRETLLHFLERVRRSYPQLTRLRRRDDDTLMLDEEAGEDRGRRFLRIHSNAIKLGHSNPQDSESVAEFCELIFTQAPSHLSLSDLDFDYLEVAFAFDLEYRGNHDELVAETLFPDHPLLAALNSGSERIIDCQPFFGATLTPNCERQVYLELKGRTSTYEIRTQEFEAQPLTVSTTVRQYWGFGGGKDLVAVHRELLSTAEHYATECAVPHIVQPLASAIASRR